MTNNAIKCIESAALKEIELCGTLDELRKAEKKWDSYLKQVNKFLAGKRDEPPYFDEKGTVI